MSMQKLLHLFALYSILTLSCSAFIVSRHDCKTSVIIRRASSSSSIRCASENAAFDDTVLVMLQRMTTFVSSMVDPPLGRFYSLSRPPTQERLHQHNPIRDLAAAWDATTLLDFWVSTNQHSIDAQIQQTLCNATLNTIEAYDTFVSVDSGGVALDSTVLKEPSNVAHSALLLLSSINAINLSILSCQQESIPINDLVRGILGMQRPTDGAFCITFNSDVSDTNVYTGIEFYPGEAMVALMEVHSLSLKMNGILEESTRQAILPAMKQAFEFYSNYYHEGDVDTNYNIWQVQAFARLLDALVVDGDTDEEMARLVADYVLELCLGIVESRSWKELGRGRSFYPNLETIEICCGLDVIAEGIRVALLVNDDAKATLLWRNAKNAIYYLQEMQNQVPLGEFGSGGLGFGGIQVMEQRLDVTGHAMSALVKLVRLGKDNLF